MKARPDIIAVVTAATRLDQLKARKATAGAAAFSLQRAHQHERLRMGGEALDSLAAQVLDDAEAAASFDQYEDEDRVYQDTLKQLRADLALGHPLSFVDRAYLPNFDFGRCLATVVVGPDGLVANTAKYTAGLPLVAVNPDPARNDGILLPFAPRQARAALRRVIAGKARTEAVTLAAAETNDGQRMLAFNDFFIGRRSHASARYLLRQNQRGEAHSSSGVIVSTGAGATGWFSSVLNQHRGLTRWLRGEPGPGPVLRRSDPRLLWIVREPFISRHSSADLVAGEIQAGDELVLESLMPQDGVLFSDGIEADFIEFNSGTIVRITVAGEKANLVVG